MGTRLLSADGTYRAAIGARADSDTVRGSTVSLYVTGTSEFRISLANNFSSECARPIAAAVVFFIVAIFIKPDETLSNVTCCGQQNGAPVRACAFKAEIRFSPRTHFHKFLKLLTSRHTPIATPIDAGSVVDKFKLRLVVDGAVVAVCAVFCERTVFALGKFVGSVRIIPCRLRLSFAPCKIISILRRA